MTLPRLAALNAYWQDHPPTHLLLAAYVDFKSRKGKGDSWIARGLSVAQAIEEAKKAHPMAHATDFAADIATATGMGFQVDLTSSRGK